LKSAVKREVDKRKALNGELSPDDIMEMSYEFQEAVIDVLAYKLIQVAEQKGVKTVLLAG
jgi:tRNA A37 threonylcarbamoyltransferase TsaD